MYDFIKLLINVNDPVALKQRVEFTYIVSQKTGLLSNLEKGQLENLDLMLIGSRLTISGSIHKYSNILFQNQDQNYDDFNLSSFKQAVTNISNQLGIDLKTAKVLKLEVGVNLSLDKNVTMTICENIIGHKYSQRGNMESYNGKGQALVFKRTEYWLKLYDKGRQYHLEEHIIRLEVKYQRSSILNRYGVCQFSDLLEVNTMKVLGNDLLNRMNEVLIVDTLNLSFMPNGKNKELLTYMLNPINWASLRKELSAEPVRKRKRRFENLLELYGMTKIKHEILDSASDKINKLIYEDEIASGFESKIKSQKPFQVGNE